MSGRGAPWWMLVLAASYLAYFGLLFYCEVRRPEALGLLVAFRSTGMVLQDVLPGSAGARAGLRRGDQIVEIEGRLIRARGDWVIIEVNLKLDEPIHLLVQRQDERFAVDVAIGRESARFWRTSAGLVLLTVRLTQLLTLTIALLVAFKRPYDGLARLGAWLLASGSVFSLTFPYRVAAVWRDLGPAGWLLWAPFTSAFAIGAILFTFFAVFPRPLFRNPLTWAAAWTPMVGVLAWFVPGYASMVYRPRLVADAPGARLAMITTACYGAVGLVALALNYRRIDNVNERRRMRVIIPGSVVGLLAGFVLIIVYWGRSPADSTGALFASPTMAVGAFMLLALPVSFAYAILRRRMFDLSTLLRQGVRYALARRGVLLLVPLLFAVLAADLALQRERSLVDVMAARRGAYVALIGLALFAYWRRERWLAALDRRFFRERYNAQRLVRQVTADLRDADSVDAVAPYVVAQIEAALHPQFAALMLRSPVDTSFRSLASAPAGAAPLPLSSASRLVALVRVLAGPLWLGGDHESSLTQQLPRAERDFVRGWNVDLVLPITMGGEGDELVLVLGSKRSEEPYSAEDLDLLAGLAHALALVVERPKRAARPGVLLEECPDCGRCYDAGTGVCTQGQVGLTPTSTERLLARRYRLDRRLRRGGMGAVYEALDVALERTVAVKLIHDEWTRSGDGPDRFRREARIAASFAHPNVVTVYDFGLTGQGRAFLVMELLQGTSLRDELRRQARLPVARALSVLRGVCTAVEAAHRRGLIHRDLKPENLFLATVESIEIVKVLDFGLARPVSSNGDERVTRGMMLGTLPYMSPEQLRNDPPGPGWDIWSLGVVAYELLTGALPFATETSESPAMPSGTGAAPVWPEPLAARLRGNLAPFQRFFTRALAIDPRSRPAGAHEFFVAFEDAADASEGLALARL
jgi:hypothetical protein